MKKKILVIDDDTLILNAMKKILNRKFPEMEVVTAGSVEEGLNKVAEINSSLALIISDLQIGKSLGSELFAAIDARSDHASTVPRIYMSGNDEKRAKIRFGNLGRYDLWLVKPAEIEEICSGVRTLLKT